MAKEWKKSGCPFCALNCTLEVLVEDDHIIDVRPNPDSKKEPGGYCCRKGRSVRYWQDNPERLDYPLKKVGDHFERISWEQAYREIGEKARAIYDKYGPKAFAFVGYGTPSGAVEGVALTGIKQALEAQYYYNPIGFEFMGAYWSLGRIFGNQNIYVEPDDQNVDTIVYWGANSYVANHFIASHRFYIKDMSEREDKRVIVVDPRLSETARMADMHIMPKNGSDVLFMRGLIAMIVDKGLEDRDFLEKYCSNWYRAEQWFRGFDYREAFRVCGVPYEQAEEFVDILTTTTWGCHAELGIICGKHSTLGSYLLLTLMAVTGNLLVKGNVMIDGLMRGGPTPDERDPDVWRLEETGMFPVQGTYPVAAFAKELLSEKESRHRAVFVCKANPARSYPDSAAVERGLDRADLVVSLEMVMTETSRHADYVLPGKTGFENHDFSFFPLTYPNVVWFLRHPVIGQIGKRRENAEIILGIAKAMGFVPETPEWLVKLAVKSCEKKDLPLFMIPFTVFLKKHPDYEKSMVLMLLDVFSRPECLGSASRASARIIAAIDYLSALGVPQRGGFTGKKRYEPLRKVEQARILYDMNVMDEVFWAADADPNGVVVGPVEPDPDKRARDHIFYKDKKIRIYDPDVDRELRMHVPDKVEKELALDGEFDLVISSGNHKDSGMDNSMRNPDTYVFRKPYELTMNPDDAADRGIEDGETVRIVTRGGSIEAPVMISYRANRGYAMIPHHFGYDTRKGRYGEPANAITTFEDRDMVTGDPAVRYVPGRVEKIMPGEGGKAHEG